MKSNLILVYFLSCILFGFETTGQSLLESYGNNDYRSDPFKSHPIPNLYPTRPLSSPSSSSSSGPAGTRTFYGKSLKHSFHLREPDKHTHYPSEHSKHKSRKVCKISPGYPEVDNNHLDVKPCIGILTSIGKTIYIEEPDRNPVPYPPNIILVGFREKIPYNYSTPFVERSEVNLTSSISLRRPPLNIRTEARYSGDIGQLAESLSKHKNRRPKPNTFQTVTYILQTPNNSAPIDGINNPNGFFKAGIYARKSKYPNRIIGNPLESQIRAITQVFDQLRAIESQPLPSGRDSDINSLLPGEEIDAPLLSVQIQRFTVPEPNSGDRSFLDSSFNFGLPAHTFVFGDLELSGEQYEIIRSQRAKLNVTGLGGSSQEISDTLTGWIKGYVKTLRRASAAAYNRAELIAYKGFRQYQFVIEPFSVWPVVVDPSAYSGTTSIHCSSGGISLSGPPPDCIPPSDC